MRIDRWRAALAAIDAALAGASLYVAFALRFGSAVLAPDWVLMFQEALIPIIAFRVLTLFAFGIYRISARHTSIRDLEVIGLSTLISSLAFAAYAYAFGRPDFPKTVIVIDWFVNLFFVAGLRVAYRIVVDEPITRLRTPRTAEPRRLLILGAGARGGSLAREIRRRGVEGLQLVGFLDDDPGKKGLLIHGVPVLGSTHDVRRIVEEREIDEVIIAIPSATGKEIRDITVRCEDLPVHLRISPGFSELNGCGDQLKTLRDVQVEDLLRRKPVEVDTEEIAAYLAGQRVLVTGAGGSIGSELVRQIVAVGPAEVILLGHGENSVFEIEQELIATRKIRPACVIADTRDYNRLRGVFDAYRPTVVFHAAAHKHVPLMELNPEEAITCNVLGTRNLARLASQYGVKRFVMISTDKAVNPSSIMGASKRVAELVVHAESLRSDTEFATVRFGNVLGSRGSVVPLMRKQIERGGPVTVTHADVQRYFMTIPEAVQLVIQAGAMSGRGATYILDMGEPMRIMDLARDLIRLSGLVPGKDIEIEITGLRPGEKLFEEILTSEEGAAVTRHERIYAAPPPQLDVQELDRKVDRLIQAARDDQPAQVVWLLRDLVPSYTGPDAAAVPVEGPRGAPRPAAPRQVSAEVA